MSGPADDKQAPLFVKNTFLEVDEGRDKSTTLQNELKRWSSDTTGRRTSEGKQDDEGPYEGLLGREASSWESSAEILARNLAGHPGLYHDDVWPRPPADVGQDLMAHQALAYQHQMQMYAMAGQYAMDASMGMPGGMAAPLMQPFMPPFMGMPPPFPPMPPLPGMELGLTAPADLAATYAQSLQSWGEHYMSLAELMKGSIVPTAEDDGCSKALGSSGARSSSSAQAPERPVARRVAKSPKTRGTADVEAMEDEKKTTFMMRHLPNDLKRDQLLELLNKKGFYGKYDFIYLPIDFSRSSQGRQGNNKGYAFVSLTTHEAALELQQKLSGHKDWGNIRCGKEPIKFDWCDKNQGLEAHIARYRNSPVMHESVDPTWKPVIFKDGKEVEFPPPTKRIRQPRAAKGLMNHPE